MTQSLEVTIGVNPDWSLICKTAGCARRRRDDLKAQGASKMETIRMEDNWSLTAMAPRKISMWPLPGIVLRRECLCRMLRSSENGKPVSYRQGFGAEFGKTRRGQRRRA
jgi:hypothetical protein